MFKKYREVYKVLERRWQTVHGFSFRDFSGWNAAQQSYITRYRPLWLIIEDWATMQRIWVTMRLWMTRAATTGRATASAVPARPNSLKSWKGCSACWMWLRKRRQNNQRPERHAMACPSGLILCRRISAWIYWKNSTR